MEAFTQFPRYVYSIIYRVFVKSEVKNYLKLFYTT